MSRKFSTPVENAKPEVASVKKSGSTFLQRFSAFLAGCGVGFGVSVYFIYNELVESNERIDKRLKLLEGKVGR